ncbi:MAG: nitroreductase family protein [Deltaproteobacteria bacterium]|nr:nitroreductase family protein [Deltaproteobacteria bacterium]MBW2009877.1 nitroreductase family protein [Deltaproteobacteria bacterium]
MTLIMVDQDKCKKDGICARDCPTGIIKFRDDGSFPELVQGGERFCLRCGHCVAVCPHGAFDHAEIPRDVCPAIVKENEVSLDQAVQFLRSRRSIRRYKERVVEREKIERLIEIARYAPTGGNAQHVQWTVVTDPSRLKRIAETSVDFLRHRLKTRGERGVPPYFPLVVAAWDAGFDTVIRNAPVLLAASAPAEADDGLVDVAIALSYLELAALPMGLGTCWAGLVQAALLHWEPTKEALGLPKGHGNHYPMMLGYPVFPYHRLPERKAPVIHWK